MRELKEKKEKKLEECFVLWKQTSKSGKEYLTGHDLHNRKLVAFYNSTKKNPKEPDVRIYLQAEKGKENTIVASLWETLSKNGEKRYLTGSTTDKEKLLAFYGDEVDNKKPIIRAYFGNEE